MDTARGDEPKSLLRRLLIKAELARQTEVQQSDRHRAPPGDPAELPRSSPIRPAQPETTSTAIPLIPSAPESKPLPIPLVITTTEERLQAETALFQLRQKTAQVANEFAAGTINRVQFSSLYNHYNEKVIIIERMLARDPNTQAWVPVARAGQTTFLKQRYEARALAFALFDYHSLEPITIQANNALAHNEYPAPAIQQTVTAAQEILQALQVIRQNQRSLRPLSRPVEGSSQWITIIPGTHTVAMIMFTLEPATYQVKIARDLHLDFERANRHALERHIRQPEQLVFPQRALIEPRAEA